MFFNFAIKSKLPVVAPISMCCNCGCTDKIEVLMTDLRRMPMLGLACIEIKVALSFP